MSETEIIVKMDKHLKLKGGSYVRDLIRCEDCKYFDALNNDDHGWCKLISDLPCEMSIRYDDDFCSFGERGRSMSRYIDAEILLDAMRHLTLGETDVARSEMKIVHYICHMPHIDDVRENVRGEWVTVVEKTEMYDKEGVKTWGALCQCNKCGFVLNAVEAHIGQYNFCPNCGADMRGEL